MSNWKKDAIQTGGKLFVKGKMSKEDIIRSITHELTTLEERYSIEYFSDFNIYFQMYKDDQKTLLVNENIIPVHSVHTIEPNNYKIVTKLDDGSKNIKYNKDINSSSLISLMDSVREDVKKTANEYYLLNAKEYGAIIEQRKRKENEANDEYERRAREKELAYQKERDHELEKINKFKSILVNVYKFKTVKDLERATTSINKLTSKYRMKQYVPEIMIPENNQVLYKASFKDGHVDIYDNELFFIYKHTPK